MKLRQALGQKLLRLVPTVSGNNRQMQPYKDSKWYVWNTKAQRGKKPLPFGLVNVTGSFMFVSKKNLPKDVDPKLIFPNTNLMIIFVPHDEQDLFEELAKNNPYVKKSARKVATNYIDMSNDLLGFEFPNLSEVADLFRKLDYATVASRLINGSAIGIDQGQLVGFVLDERTPSIFNANQLLEVLTALGQVRGVFPEIGSRLTPRSKLLVNELQSGKSIDETESLKLFDKAERAILETGKPLI